MCGVPHTCGARSYQWSETASTTVSKTETDSFQYTVPVPPGQCFKLWLQNAETTTTARLVQQANVTRSIAMFFGGPGAPVRFQATNNGWFWASGWLQLAQQLGYQLSPWFASLQDNVWEKVDLVDVTYFDAKAWMTTLKPTDPQCQVCGSARPKEGAHSRRGRTRKSQCAPLRTRWQWLGSSPALTP